MYIPRAPLRYATSALRPPESSFPPAGVRASGGRGADPLKGGLPSARYGPGALRDRVSSPTYFGRALQCT